MVRHRSNSSKDSGFTLLELIVVMLIIGVLAAMAVPAFTHHLKVAREAVLKEDLHTMRQAIDSFTVDKQKAPQALDELVTSGYLKSMPLDPMTHRTDTWIGDRTDAYQNVDETATGINDVHSGSQALSTEGTIYGSW
ncbi:MAG: type II secretion system protein [Janthinobacterium lividum]